MTAEAASEAAPAVADAQIAQPPLTGLEAALLCRPARPVSRTGHPTARDLRVLLARLREEPDRETARGAPAWQTMRRPKVRAR